MSEEGPSVCERCGGELRRVIYPSGIIFKGSGFYRTDSRAASNGSAKESRSDKPSDNAPAKSDSNGGTTSLSPTTGSGDSSKA